MDLDVKARAKLRGELQYSASGGVSRKESRHHMDIEPETSHGPPVTSHQGAWASRQRLILSRILLGLGLRV